MPDLRYVVGAQAILMYGGMGQLGQNRSALGIVTLKSRVCTRFSRVAT
jgi:hypothetical protein